MKKELDKRTLAKKLQLSRETVSVLTKGDLSAVVGGTGGGWSGTWGKPNPTCIT